MLQKSQIWVVEILERYIKFDTGSGLTELKTTVWALVEESFYWVQF